MNQCAELIFRAPLVDARWRQAFVTELQRVSDWLNQCEQIVVDHYAGDPAARDGFSRVACGLVSAGRLEEALAWFERDAAVDRMGRWQFLQHLEALLARGRTAEAETCVKTFYANHPEARDGMATIAGYFRERGDHDQAHALLTRDRETGRLSPFWTLILADEKARSGEWELAAELVDDAYAANAGLKDGYSRLAWQKAAKGDVSSAVELFELDRTNGRMSRETSLSYAGWLASDRPLSAIEVITAMYAADSGIVDSFAWLAEIELRAGNQSAALVWFERDEQVGRLSPKAMQRYAELLSRENPAKAEKVVENAYKIYPAMNDGFSRLGWQRLKEGDRPGAVALIERDLRLGRLSPANQLDYACLVARDSVEDAERLVEQAYSRDAGLRDGYSRIGHCAAGNGRSASSLPFIKKDRAENRLGDGWRDRLFSWCSEELSGRGRVAEIAKRLAQWLPADRLKSLADDLLSGKLDSVRPSEFVLGRLVRDGRLCLDDAELEFGDPESLRILIEEILVFQCYYFPTENPHPRIIDGGANFGLTTWYFRKLYPGSIIHAFEPDRNMAAILRRNAGRNGWDNVEIHETALSGKSGSATFFSTPDETIAGSLSGNTAARGLTQTTYEVECRPLSGYLEHPVDFLKLDIEGAECAVFQEAAGRLDRIKHLFCEVHRPADGGNRDLVAIVQLLESAGFRVEVTGPSRLAPGAERGVENIMLRRSHQLWASRKP